MSCYRSTFDGVGDDPHEKTYELIEFLLDLTYPKDIDWDGFQTREVDEDSGKSPLSIIEIPHLRAAAGCC